MSKVFVVSSYLFDKYILRPDCVERYINTPCCGKTFEDISGYVVDVLDGFYNEVPVRYYVDWGATGFGICPDSGVNWNNLDNRIILVEDYKLDKFEAYHWKDYVYKRRGM